MVEVPDSPAVAHHQIFVSPFVPENLGQQAVAPAARLPLETLVGAHDLLHVGLLHQRLEGRQVGLPQIPRVQMLHVEIVPLGLRAAMHGIMLGTGVELVVLRVPRPLEAFHHGHPHTGGQPRVFPPGLLSPSPARVAEDVHVGRPERQPLVHLPEPPVPVRLVVFGAGLVAHRGIHLLHRLLIERGSHPHRDGIDRGQPAARHAMQGLAPPVVRLDAQVLHSRRGIDHQRHLLLQGQPPQQVVRPFGGRKRGIPVSLPLRPCA